MQRESVQGAQELCESRGGRPCGRKATFKEEEEERVSTFKQQLHFVQFFFFFFFFGVSLPVAGVAPIPVVEPAIATCLSAGRTKS